MRARASWGNQFIPSLGFCSLWWHGDSSVFLRKFSSFDCFHKRLNVSVLAWWMMLITMCLCLPSSRTRVLLFCKRLETLPFVLWPWKGRNRIGIRTVLEMWAYLAVILMGKEMRKVIVVNSSSCPSCVSFWEGNRQEGQGSPNRGNKLQVSDIFISLKRQKETN